MTTLADKIEARAKRIRGYIASSQRVVELLAPEQAKFDARKAPWDTYTVRISVDHMSSIRTQTKEAEELEAVVIALRERDQAVEALRNMVEAFGNPDAGAVDRRLAMKDALTTLASIEGTGHDD